MTATENCPECGQTLPADAPAGVCPKCLLAVGLYAAEDTSIEVSEQMSSSGSLPKVTKIQYFGDYELLEEIARGGMGVVYRARQTSLNRIVALKMILSGEHASPIDIERFHIEAQAAANLKHPNIVAIHEVGQHEGRSYFSMDYIDGQNLADIIKEGPVPNRKAAQYMKMVAEAVHYAHQCGTLHRDLKPQNLLIDGSDQPQITDFGLAKQVEDASGLTATGMILGTPSYMSPEQALGQADIGPRSDVYSLGAVLYELLTGRPPFCAASVVETLRQVTDKLPAAPHTISDHVPPDLETICLKCLEKSPHARFQSAHELAADLGRFLDHEPIQARPVSPFRKVETWLRQRPWAITVTAALTVLALVCVVYLQFEQNRLLQYQQAHPEYVRQAGQRTNSLENTLMGLQTYGCLAVFGAYLVYRMKSLRMTHWQQWFEQAKQLKEPRPVSTPVRFLCAAVGLSVLAGVLFATARIIEAHVWEGLPAPLVHASIIFILFFLSLQLLVQIAQDYRQAVYGSHNPQIDPEQLAAMREFVLNGDMIGAIKLYRTTVPTAGFDEARRFVARLALEVEAEDPEQFAARQPSPWNVNWRGVSICLAVEAILCAGWWMLRPLAIPPGLIITGFLGGWLFGVILLTSYRIRNLRKRLMFFAPMATLGPIVAVIGRATFSTPVTPLSSFSLPMVGAFFGVALAVSAANPKTHPKH